MTHINDYAIKYVYVFSLLTQHTGF